MKSIKCVVVGDGNVGKTSLLIKYTTDKFPKEYVPTVFDNYSRPVTFENESYELSLFDTVGHCESYDRLGPMIYPGTNVFLICFNVDSIPALENAGSKWLDTIHHYCPGVPFVLVATKIDLREDAETIKKMSFHKMGPVTSAEGYSYSRQWSASIYVECSALEGTGVEKVFDAAVAAAISPPPVKKKICTACVIA